MQWRSTMRQNPSAASQGETVPNLTVPNLERRVEERFGVLPNFFRLTPEIPEITEKLWGFAEAAYLDNPLPSLFKERLFVQLSRFCVARYCIARHVGFLTGLGRPSGDAQARINQVEDVVRLLQRPLARGSELDLRLSLCATCPSPLADMPFSDSQVEDAIFAFASHVFLQTSDAPVCLDALKRLLGGIRFQHLMVFLLFIRAAHYWTEVHPELEFEDDIKQFLATHEALAKCVLSAPEGSADVITQSLLDELPALRQKADKAIGLLAAIVDSSDDAIVSKTLDGVITSWNKGAERLFGYTAQEAVGQHISLIVPADRKNEEKTILARLSRGERIDHFDTLRVRKDGTIVDISLTISPVADAAGKIIGASKIARDISERKQTERGLRESEDRFRTLADALETQVQFRTQELQRRNREILQQTEQLRDLSRRLLQIQDEERRHIARELHDSAGQTLAGLGMSLSRLAQDAKNNPDQLAKSIEEAEGLVQHLTQEIRTTSYLLHPPLLDESGLSSALNWYVQGLKERSGLEIDLRIAEDFGRLPADMELVIFRLVQESLTNVHRHSRSKTAFIRVARKADKVFVEVHDKGNGMSAERLAEIQSRGAGLGIRGMRERLRHFNGELLVESNDTGTKIFATLQSQASAAKAPVVAGPGFEVA
jgi:PAS domain S-box-containing protein